MSKRTTEALQSIINISELKDLAQNLNVSSLYELLRDIKGVAQKALEEEATARKATVSRLAGELWDKTFVDKDGIRRVRN